MKTIFITGGSGFIGQRLCSSLKDQGYNIVAPTRNDVGDYNYIKNWGEIIKGADIVIHLGAIAHRACSEVSDNEYIITNRDLTDKLIAASIKESIKKFIFISTSKVYGEKGIVPFKETDNIKPQDIYSKSKSEAENKLISANNNNTNIIILRIPLVYGPGVKANFKKLMFLSKLPVGIDYSIFKNKKSYLSLYNFVSVIKYIIEYEFTENKNIFNVTDNCPYSVEQIVNEYREICGLKKIKSIKVKEGQVKKILSILKKKELFDKLYDEFLLDNNKIKKLGWKPDYDLKSTFKEMKKNNLI